MKPSRSQSLWREARSQTNGVPTPPFFWNGLRNAYEWFKASGSFQLRIHPEDAQRLSSALNEMVEDLKPSLEIQVTEDTSVGKFGVILQTPDTTIDRSLQTQLKRLEEELQ